MNEGDPNRLASSHTFIKCNVASWDAQVAMFKHAINASPNGGIDIVVANAGIGESDKDVFSLDGPKGESVETLSIAMSNRAKQSPRSRIFLP